MSGRALPDLSVLIVDDIRAMRLLIRSTLRSFGVTQICEAGDGAEALRMVKEKKIDLIVTDLNMAPMSGLDFTRELRQPRYGTNAFLPILMISGHKDAGNVKAAIEAGVTDFIVKPLIPANFRLRLQAMIDSPKPRIQTASYSGPDRRRRAMWVRHDRRDCQPQRVAVQI